MPAIWASSDMGCTVVLTSWRPDVTMPVGMRTSSQRRHTQTGSRWAACFRFIDVPQDNYRRLARFGRTLGVGGLPATGPIQSQPHDSFESPQGESPRPWRSVQDAGPEPPIKVSRHGRAGGKKHQGFQEFSGPPGGPLQCIRDDHAMIVTPHESLVGHAPHSAAQMESPASLESGGRRGENTEVWSHPDSVPTKVTM